MNKNELCVAFNMCFFCLDSNKIFACLRTSYEFLYLIFFSKNIFFKNKTMINPKWVKIPGMDWIKKKKYEHWLLTAF